MKMKNNIICIDLRMFNHLKLKEVCDKYDFHYETLLENKNNGFAKLWIDSSTKLIIASSMKKDNRVNYSDAFTDLLSNISPIELQKQPKSFDLDSILEKISSYGIDSLKQDEKDFLKGL